jgi:hypothetical protein
LGRDPQPLGGGGRGQQFVSWQVGGNFGDVVGATIEMVPERHLKTFR